MDAFGVSKGLFGDALVSAKVAREKRKPKPKKGNMILRPVKTLKALSVAKGAYSESMEGIQRDRQKANRRRSVGHTLTGAAALGSGVAILQPDLARRAGYEAGKGVHTVGRKLSRDFKVTGNVIQMGKPKKTEPAGRLLMRAGEKIVAHPGRAAGGALVGTAVAGFGLRGAGMLHNARSNRNARKYNRRKANSRIKIVPTSGKNRF